MRGPVLLESIYFDIKGTVKSLEPNLVRLKIIISIAKYIN